MSVYFAGAIRGGREDRFWYQEIITLLKEWAPVSTEHIGDVALGADGNKGMTRADTYKQDMDWLLSADVFVGKVSTPSLGVGYELAIVEQRQIPALLLYNSESGANLSAMIGGCPYFGDKVFEYKERDINAIRDTVKDFMDRHYGGMA